jgi:two-component system, chemotaxis family, protein-glutamate methylesterase/glutaminase
MAFAIAVLGTSLGGLKALRTVLSALPGDFALPLAIVQHRGPSTDDTLRGLLQAVTTLAVREAEDKEALAPGHVYLAPASYHLLVERGQLSLSVDDKVNAARPAIDVLFESAAASYGPRVLGIVLTGASHDGAQGALCIKRRGGRVLVQDPREAESAVMPEAVISAGAADEVLTLSALATRLAMLARG